MPLLVADPNKTTERRELQQRGRPQLLDTANFVVCLAVANTETEILLNAAAFARMKPTAYFINAPRGNLVDEQTMEDALT
jgi:D-3-phosphoglycerate dehydrogenase